MGCDIHFVVERKIEEDKWVGLCSTDWGYHPPLKQRDYTFFGALANVRRPAPHGIDPKGVPDDASALTKLCVESWGPDGHSHSWHTLLDFCRASPRWDHKEDAISDFIEDSIGLYLNSFLSNYRVIFWFDN